MGVASGCGEQEVGVASGSGWNLWVWLLGVVLRRYIDFLILLIPTPLVSVLFLLQHPYFFVHFVNLYIEYGEHPSFLPPLPSLSSLLLPLPAPLPSSLPPFLPSPPISSLLLPSPLPSLSSSPFLPFPPISSPPPLPSSPPSLPPSLPPSRSRRVQ